MSHSTANGKVIPIVFTATIFLSASLLFFVQPLFAKIVLPEIGGAPAVWTTAMLFFQTVLIVGYVYAHFSSRYLPVTAQMVLHLSLWVAALAFLPLGIPEGWQYDGSGSTARQTLLLFAAGVGLPFAVLSANAPLIQSWYACSDGPSADDPYFLYGASNLGSLMALLAFPFVAEPLFGAHQIGIGFAGGFVLLGMCLFASGMAARTGRMAKPNTDRDALECPGPRTYCYWALLAFVPSSLMLAVTTKVSTDLGSIPLVWVIPLSLYLLTFVIGFSKIQFFNQKPLKIAAALSITVAGLFFTGFAGAHLSLPETGVLVLVFFIIAMWAHRSLYETRPNGRYLTLFYVTMSVGGALGGLFNSIIAPLAFNAIYEGIVTVGVAAILIALPWLDLSVRNIGRGLLFGMVAGGVYAIVVPILGDDQQAFASILLIGLTGAVFVALRRSLTSALIASIAVSGAPLLLSEQTFHFKDRSFFGLHKVSDQNDLRLYSNGTTSHGAQRLSDLTAPRPEPITYYHVNGPMAQILTSKAASAATSIGIVGLGVGSLACYSQPGQDWHFYEIDKMVDRVARDTSLFTFVSSCTPDAPTHLGDARVVLENQSDIRFDVLVIDAYSSDAVPVHLTTREAVDMYMSRLNDDGILLFHISNRYYDIWRPLGRTAETLGLAAWRQYYNGNRDTDPGDYASEVVAFTQGYESQFALDGDTRWQRLESDGGVVWTDDRANLLSILRWRNTN